MVNFGGKTKKSVANPKHPSVCTSQIDEDQMAESVVQGSICVSEEKSIFSKKFIENPSKEEKIFYQNKRIVLYKTEMCRSFSELGFCKYGDRCQFCHITDEKRKVQRHPRYKTEICKTFWNEGSCPYGSRCCFVHLENQNIVQSLFVCSNDLLEIKVNKDIKKIECLDFNLLESTNTNENYTLDFNTDDNNNRQNSVENSDHFSLDDCSELSQFDSSSLESSFILPSLNESLIHESINSSFATKAESTSVNDCCEFNVSEEACDLKCMRNSCVDNNDLTTRISTKNLDLEKGELMEKSQIETQLAENVRCHLELSNTQFSYFEEYSADQFDSIFSMPFKEASEKRRMEIDFVNYVGNGKKTFKIEESTFPVFRNIWDRNFATTWCDQPLFFAFDKNKTV